MKSERLRVGEQSSGMESAEAGEKWRVKNKKWRVKNERLRVGEQSSGMESAEAGKEWRMKPVKSEEFVTAAEVIIITNY